MRGSARPGLVCQLALGIGVELALRELRSLEQLAEALEELFLQRREGQVATVGGLVDAVGGEPAGQEPRDGITAQAVGGEMMRTVRHGHDEMRTAAGLLALEQSSKYPVHRGQRARRQVRDLRRR